ncbi:GNAT family N-acetyltransferase [Cognatishimia activa]|uniref:N-acetyltransferase domain-containing protein n=1 Tax=Cognatishimia activa TaxID=1715691 RepID=A0A0P1ILY4_9RHOB|nr:N-acetyltransferase [Cognatishimia activa]CUI40333.1 hypothetical protein TA5113_00396 [Cognatishimia activa]CUK24548.1 hypothetical protein TA5114_00333 [Cognatishimia activa]
MNKLVVRPAGKMDARKIASLMNEIIKAGGTTAITTELTAQDILDLMQEGQRAAWHVAEDEACALYGLQWFEEHPDLPKDVANIATFTRVGKTGLGIGSRLFEATLKSAKDLGYQWINANIRADNEGGLIYYQSRGFENHSRQESVKLADGTLVDKVIKRYRL